MQNTLNKNGSENSYGTFEALLKIIGIFVEIVSWNGQNTPVEIDVLVETFKLKLGWL